jgi:pimeloyl-ACP methyl ester carboxylesterase
VHRIVSPLHRTPVVDRSRMLVMAGRSDRITPMAYARRLAKHFDAPLETWPGGHLLQLGRLEVFRRAVARLADHGALAVRAR